MSVLLALVLLFSGTLGLGALGLYALGLSQRLPTQEIWAWAWALGLGILGWLVFPMALAGWVQPIAFGLFLGLACLGLLLLPRPQPVLPFERSFLPLLAGLGLVLALVLAVGIAPPSDADSLAYHFARPRRVLLDGHLSFLPLAVDGAIPLLMQMTYLPALALGGEKAMTLWATISGVMPAYVLFVFARRWLGLSWSLGLVLLLLTTPAMVYGLGSGQVETRVIPFVLAGVLAVAGKERETILRRFLLAGLLAGFYAGAKYFGLFFIAALGFTVLARRHSLIQIERADSRPQSRPVNGFDFGRPALLLRGGLLFGLAALMAGGPWYGWNFLHTGDPVFPALFRFLNLPDSAIWTAAQDAYFQEAYRGTELPAPKSLGMFLAYPFIATFDGFSRWESSRTGLGPLAVLLFPFALAALPRRLHGLSRQPLAQGLFVAFVFMALWFFLGTSQRVRHLVPFYPLLLLALLVAAERASRSLPGLKPPLLTALGLVLVFQAGGFLLYAKKPVQAAWSAMGREAYLNHAVGNYAPVSWLNTHLGPTDLLVHFERQLNYFLDIPNYYASVTYQSRIDFNPFGPDDFAKRWNQMRAMGATHMLLIPATSDLTADIPPSRTARAFLNQGCAKELAVIPVVLEGSRTLPGFQRLQQEAQIIELTPASCPL
ncbi:MAG: hypothetical protein EPN26_08965 [Rhodospirillales bacterium]|nr:MAG: hypothetical protein EPN26_08965 [Rhodospirillales bacterium]